MCSASSLDGIEEGEYRARLGAVRNGCRSKLVADVDINARY